MRALHCPELHPHVIVADRGDDEVMVLSPDGTAFPVNRFQAAVLQRLDGRTELAQIAAACEREFEQPVGVTELEEFVADIGEAGLLSPRERLVRPDAAKGRCRATHRWLRAHGLPPRTGNPYVDDLGDAMMRRLADRDPHGAILYAHALHEATGGTQWSRKVVERLDALDDASGMEDSTSLRLLLPLVDPSRFLGTLHRWFGWVFTPLGLLAYALFCAGGIWLALQIEPIPARALISPWVLLVVFFTTKIDVVIHELCHSLTCHHFGGRVRRMGVGLLMGVILIAYSDITSSDLFERRWQRIAVLAAGVLGNFFSLSLWLYIASVFPNDDPIHQGLVVGVILTATQALFFNLVPFIRLDGYFILAQLVGMDGLYDKAFAWSRARLGRFFAGPSVELPEHTARERLLLTTFSLSAVLFIVFAVGYGLSLLYGYLSAEWRGYGVATVVLMVLSIYWPPISRAVVDVVRFTRQHWRAMVQPARLVRSAVALGLPLALALGLRTEESTRATFEIETEHRVEVSAKVSGQVAEVLVAEGEAVTRGQLLVRLEDRALQAREQTLRGALAEASWQLRWLDNGATPQELRLVERRAALASERAQTLGRRADRQRRLFDQALTPADASDRADAAEQAARVEALAADVREALVREGPREEVMVAAQAHVAELRSQLELVREDLEHLSVRSPADGIVVTPHPELLLDAQVARGEPLLVVHDPERVVARLTAERIPWSDDPQGCEVKLVLPHGVARTATIASVETDQPGRAAIIVRTAPLQGSRLRDGMTGPARIYGPEVSLATEYLVRPVMHFVTTDLWAVL